MIVGHYRNGSDAWLATFGQDGVHRAWRTCAAQRILDERDRRIRMQNLSRTWNTTSMAYGAQTMTITYNTRIT